MARLRDLWGGSTPDDRRRRPYDSGYADSLQHLRSRSRDPEYARGYAFGESVKEWVRLEAHRLASGASARGA